MSEQMREEFRAAYERQFDTCPRGYIVETGDYTNDHARSAWWAWQASRAALCVALPLTNSCSNQSAYLLAVSDCREAIHAAGVKTK
jgi:hypothetical protein